MMSYNPAISNRQLDNRIKQQWPVVKRIFVEAEARTDQGNNNEK